MKTQASALGPCNSPTTFDSVCPRQFALTRQSMTTKIGTKGVHQDYVVLMVGELLVCLVFFCVLRVSFTFSF